MIEKSLVMIKPDGLDRRGEILSQLEIMLVTDFSRSESTLLQPAPKDVLALMYKKLESIPYFHDIIDFYSKGLLVMTYTGEDIIRKLRKNIGSTDPAKAEKNTIRGMFSNDSLDLAMEEKRPVRNVIHSSENKSEADREIYIWYDAYFPYL